MSSPLRPINFVWHGKLDDFVTSVAWSPDGSRLAAGAVSGQVAIYDTALGKALHIHEQAHADGCDAVAWRPDGAALATAGRDGKWKLWDADEGKVLAEHEAGAMWAEHLAWSTRPIGERGHLLALAAGNKVSLWNEQGAASGEAIKFPRTVSDIAWIMGGATLAVATSAAVSLRDPASGAEERLFDARDPILAMAFSPSGKWLMTGNQDASVHVWNTDGEAQMHMRGFPAKVRQLAWHRGSRWLATGGGPSIAVWDCSGRGPEGAHTATARVAPGAGQRAALPARGRLAGVGRARRQHRGLVADAAPEPDQPGEDRQRGDARGVVAGREAARRDRRGGRGAGAGGGVSGAYFAWNSYTFKMSRGRKLFKRSGGPGCGRPRQLVAGK